MVRSQPCPCTVHRCAAVCCVLCWRGPRCLRCVVTYLGVRVAVKAPWFPPTTTCLRMPSTALPTLQHCLRTDVLGLLSPAPRPAAIPMPRYTTTAPVSCTDWTVRASCIPVVIAAQMSGCRVINVTTTV